MYNVLNDVINRGEYSLPDIEFKIDKLWAEDKLSNSQREELISAARSEVKPGLTLEILFKTIKNLEERVTALEKGANDPPADTPPEWADGMVVYRDARITYEGKVYRCIAPEGYPCSWPPYGDNGYPPYWEEDET